ncbi:hypothetical protein [Amycolatopsis sp. NPDC051372]|uniref:NACHT N-terminal Helical domain 1-containing protein n=1 Tax=Amycolatopsis sp. NPDC051372 TaxID=3155669 RepID=UPI003412343D
MPVETALLSGQLTKERGRRRLKRVLDIFAEAVVDRIEPIVDVEFRSLPEHEKLALGWGGQGGGELRLAECDSEAEHAPSVSDETVSGEVECGHEWEVAGD